MEKRKVVVWGVEHVEHWPVKIFFKIIQPRPGGPVEMVDTSFMANQPTPPNVRPSERRGLIAGIAGLIT